MSEQTRAVLNIGIAGQGRSGYKIHADWLQHTPEKYRIVAVADPLPERREDARHEFGAKTYADYTEMLEAGGFDVFINALPTPLHVPATIEALEAGFHVLCEKPMAPMLEEFDRMVEVAERTGMVLAPFQNNRYQPFALKMREVVDSGALGRIVYVRSVWAGFARRWDWQTFQCNYGGCLFNTGPHAVDLALTFFPEDVYPSVFCRMACYNELGGDANDFCSLTLYAPDCPHVEIHISQYLAFPQGDLFTVNGTRGGLSGDHRQVRWRCYDWSEAPEQNLWKPWSRNREYPHETLPWVERQWSLDEAMAGESVGYTLRSYRTGAQYIYDSLYDRITEGKDLIVTLPQIRRQIAVLEEAHRQNPLPRKVQSWP